MNPDAAQLWRAPRWALAVLLAVLGMLGPFSVDTYIPAFSGIAASTGATPLQLQQTLSAYLFGFAFMNLFHGALSDSFGRRPVVLWGLALFTLASAGCALSQSIGQLVFFRALAGRRRAPASWSRAPCATCSRPRRRRRRWRRSPSTSAWRWRWRP